VFVAEDGELGCEVALKEMRSDLPRNEKGMARFLFEGEVTGRLEHPGVVPVYGLGTYGDGRPFYAMRFVKGDNLQEAIKQFHQSTSGAAPNSATFGSVAFRGLLRRFVDV